MSGDAKGPTGRSSPYGDRPNMSPLRVVLVGKTGAGKSSSGNTILGRKTFKESRRGISITKQCSKEVGEVAGREIVVVDTPGVFDTSRPEREVKQEISKCINMTAPGPHAIIVVIRLGPFREEERLSVEEVRAIFGEEADRHSMVLFTCGDELTDGIEEFIEEAPTALKHIISLCGGRYHVFDNTDIKNRTQVLEFLEKVDEMVAANGDEFYTSPIFQHVEQRLEERVKEIREKYRRELEEKERQFDEERRELKETIEQLHQSEQEKEQKLKELEEKERQFDEERKELQEKLKQSEKEKEQKVKELEETQKQFDEEQRELEETIKKLKLSEQEKEQKIKELERRLKQNDLKRMEYGRFYHEIIIAARKEAENSHVSDAVPRLYDNLQQSRLGST